MRNIIILMIFAFIIIGGIMSFVSYNKAYQREEMIVRDLPSVVKLRDVYDKDSSEIKSLLIRNGNTGEAKVTEDRVKIKEFYEIMQNITFIKAKNQRMTVGWSYYIDLYENDDKYSWFRITFAKIEFLEYVSKPKYKVIGSPYYTANDIDKVIAKLDELYNSIE